MYLNQKRANAGLRQPLSHSQVDCDQQLAVVPVQNIFALWKTITQLSRCYYKYHFLPAIRQRWLQVWILKLDTNQSKLVTIWHHFVTSFMQMS